MKTLILIAAIVATSPAAAEPRNDTSRALACMKKYGFTYAEWLTRTVAAAIEDVNSQKRRCFSGTSHLPAQHACASTEAAPLHYQVPLA
jgi:hypothetical protein